MARRRKSGSGTVRERKDGRWEGRIVIGYDERGLPKTKNVLAKTKTECLEKLEALKETIGATEITRCTPEMPFGEQACSSSDTRSLSILRMAFRVCTE